MMKKLKEIKVMRDPIHNYIHVEYQLLWDLINTKEFQRLRRIHQLGGTFVVFHTAEHSRFGHSLGVYEIVRRMISEISSLKEKLNDFDKITVMCAALLHDVGHGPFSHAFESVSAINHEEMTIRVILEDSEINRVLKNYNHKLPQAVASVINHTAENKLLIQLVSSQMDADRMDYLLRDSYFTGTTYGEFDLERVLRTLVVVDNQLVVKETGVHTIEDYIMARYHMYWQVYYHPTSRSFETLLVLLFRRLLEVGNVEKYPMFKGLFKSDEITVKDHFLLDENTCYYGFSLMVNDEDKILSDLASRLLNRRLFKYKTIKEGETVEDYLSLVEGYDSNYYLFIDSAKQIPYQPYVAGNENLINVYTNAQEIVELSEISTIVRAIVKGVHKEDYKIYYPVENN